MAESVREMDEMAKACPACLLGGDYKLRKVWEQYSGPSPLTGRAANAYAGIAMLFNVSGLIQEGIGATRSFELDESLESADREPEPVAGSVELLRTKTGVLVRAHLKLVEPETCSRCLRPLEETVPIEFEEEFQLTVDVRSGEALERELDEEDFRIDENHILDLTEAIRQYREASEAMQPLCKPDCLGLCPRCGRDLNAGPCGCEMTPVDSRWSALAALLPSSETEGK